LNISVADLARSWPDWLVGKMQDNRRYSHIAVVNQAAGGNRILADGLGPNVLARIERDVIAQSGVGYAMIYEGINDIGTAATTTEVQQVVGDRMIAAYKQIAMRIHAHGIPIFAATITPFMAPGPLAGSYSDPTREVTRQRVNEWIRTSRVFDAVIDFDKIVRDPAIPAQLAPPYNTGDYLHLNVSGFQALANNFPLGLFDRFAQGVDGYN
jgi:lysophospholipase L1-like esterase